MKDTMLELFVATRRVKELLTLKGDTQPVATVLGQALGWKWPEGMNEFEVRWVGRLCDLLNVNLPGRPREVR